MCFYIDKKYFEKKTAKKNIVCYKVGNAYSKDKKSFSSLFNDFQYRLNVKTPKIKLSIINYNHPHLEIIEEGYHSFKKENEAMITIGVLAYTNKLVVVKCYIPKGAKYYYNSKRREYVSNNITPLKIIAEKKTSLSKIIKYN